MPSKVKDIKAVEVAGEKLTKADLLEFLGNIHDAPNSTVISMQVHLGRDPGERSWSKISVSYERPK